MKKNIFEPIKEAIRSLTLSALTAILLFVGPTFAVDYEVGSGKTYQTLEDLRNSGVTWTSGDTITLHGNDASLSGQFDFSGALVTIKGTGKITPDTTNFRFANAPDGIVVEPDNGKILEFSGFDHGNYGGAIEAGSANVTFGTVAGTGSLIFTNNKGSYGGAVDTTGTVTLLGGTNTFSGNLANYDGGAIYGNYVTLSGGTNTFSGNLANDDGGAIFGNSVTLSGGTNTFLDNSAVFGGAIYGNNDVILLGGTNTFSGNSANDDGGAIFGLFDVILSGGTNTFLGNRAGDLGGAVYVDENGTFIAQNGDTTFRGNTDQFGANAIYTLNYDNDKTLILAGTETGTLYLYDPVRSNDSNPNLTISINHDGTDATNGTVLFDTNLSNVFGDTTVYGGTMKMTGRAGYGATGVGSFTLNSGATLATAIGSQIYANTITLEAGSILAFDLTGAVVASDAGATTNLTLDGNTVTGNPGAVDIWAFNGSGTFNLATRSGGTFTDTATLYTHGEDIANTRAAGLASLGGNGTDTLTLSSTVTNGVVTWNTNDGTWNATSTNWDTSQITGFENDNRFLHGDAVVFDTAGTHTVTIQDKGVTIAARGTNPGMEIASGSWIFTGGAIEGGAIRFTGDASVTFDSRTMRQHIEVADNQTATIQASDGETVTFIGFDNPGGYGGAIRGGNGSTVNLGSVGSNGTLVFMDNSASGNGGAVDVDGTVEILGGTNTFSRNTAGFDGGAIGGQSVAIFGGANTFNGNEAGGMGGAIFSNKDVMLSGGTNSFLNNHAGTLGGAVFADENGTFIAVDGDLMFQGNTQGAGNAPNAIYMGNYQGSKVLNLAAEAGKSVLFYDPVESRDENGFRDLTIDINKTGADTNKPTQEYTGTVLFDTYHSKVYGNTTVHNGTMQLANGAIYGGSATDNPSFTLNTGATLLSDAVGNTIQANTITLEADSILAFDLTGAAGDGSTTNLTLSGTNFTGEMIGSGTIQVNTLLGFATGDTIRLVDAGDENRTTTTGTLVNRGVGDGYLYADGNGQYLNIRIGTAALFAELAGLRPNAVPLAGAFDSMVASHNQIPIIGTITGLNDEGLIARAVNQLPGDVFATGQLVAAELQANFNGLLPTYQNDDGNYVSSMSTSTRGQSCCRKNYRNEYWGTPTGRWFERGQRSGYEGYDMSNFGVAFGVSRRINSRNHIGLAFGYDYGSLEMQGLNQKDKINALHVALYGGYVSSCDFFDWHLGYGKNYHDTTRVISFGNLYERANADYDDNVFSFGMMYGKRLGSLLPSVGLEFVQVWTPAFTESGAPQAALRSLKSDYTSLELPIGFRIRKACNNWLTPELRAFWVPQLCDERSSVWTAFAAGGPDFVVESGDLGWQHARLGAGLTAKLARGIDASMNYDASIYSGFTRQTASGAVTVRF